jgi:hypothetical protein
MKTLTLALAAILAVGSSAAAQTVDITGRWDVAFQTQQGTLPASLTIVKEQDKLGGTLSSQQGDTAISATVKEKAVTVNATVQTPNGAINMVMTGTVDGNTMAGTADFGGRASFDWSAKRAAQAPPAQQDKPAESMTGTWAFEVTHSAGVSTPTVTITQSGEKLSGKYVGSYGEADLTGSIKGTEFTFTVEIGTEQKVKAVYVGTLTGSTVKGNVTLGEIGEGTFTGKRK